MQIHILAFFGERGDEAGRDEGFAPKARPARADKTTTPGQLIRRPSRTESGLTGCAAPNKGREGLTSATSSFLSTCSSSAMATPSPLLTAGGWKPRGLAREGSESGFGVGVGEIGVASGKWRRRRWGRGL